MNYKKQLCYYASLCEQKGLVNTIEGNISILDRENGLLYITPSRTKKIDLKEEDVAVLNFETEEQIAGKKASSEYRLHKACLLARSDCNAVVHTHAPYLTAYAIIGKSIKYDCVNLFKLMLGEVKCLPYGQAGTKNIASGIEEAINDRPICLLGNHGAVSVGETLELALGWMEAVEETVKTVEIAKSIGKVNPIPEWDKVIKDFIEKNKKK